MVAFTFLSPKNISFDFYSLCNQWPPFIEKRGTLIKTYSGQWKLNHNSFFSVPFQDTKSKMMLVPFSCDFCRKNKSPHGGLYIYQFQGWAYGSCLAMFASNHLWGSLWALVPTGDSESPAGWGVCLSLFPLCLKENAFGDFLGGPVVRTCASIEGGASSIPGWETKIPHAVRIKK